MLSNRDRHRGRCIATSQGMHNSRNYWAMGVGFSGKSSVTIVLFLAALSVADGKGTETGDCTNISKIANGKPAPMDKYPYMVSLRNPRTNEHHCGGALVAKNLVVTAAHCIDPNPRSGYTIPLPTVHIGGVGRCGDVETENRKTFRTFIHKKWTGKVQDGYDIALIQLDKESSNTPIKVDFLGLYIASYRQKFIALGWGLNEELEKPLYLQEAEMEYVSKWKCKKVELYKDLLTNEMVCAVGIGRPSFVDVCSGDSGGPLILPPRTFFHDEHLLIGIVSFGRDCDRSGSEIVPSVFTEAYEFRSWISNMGEGESFVYQNPDVNTP